jgi:hypothetical protein
MSVQVSCEGMVKPTNPSGGQLHGSAVVEGRTLELRSGNIHGAQHAWAILTNAYDGDSVWLEISGDGGRHWIPCGFRTIHDGERNYTYAQQTNESNDVCMRAAMQLGPQYRTGDWCR